jgi:hypothetical protein
MLFSPRVAAGLLNSFRVFSIATKSPVDNSYSCFSSSGSLCHPIPHFQKKAADSFARFVPVLGGYQLSNIPAGTGIRSFKNSCYQPDTDIRVWTRLIFGWYVAELDLILRSI